jgi:flagellar hook protein FlgE
VLQSGALEGSNVDITQQLVNMIVAQRNFQANAQVIQTEDTITQTVINLR